MSIWGEEHQNTLVLVVTQISTSDPSLEVEMLFWPGFSPARCYCDRPSLLVCIPILHWMQTRVASSETQVTSPGAWGLCPQGEGFKMSSPA